MKQIITNLLSFLGKPQLITLLIVVGGLTTAIYSMYQEQWRQNVIQRMDYSAQEIAIIRRDIIQVKEKLVEVEKVSEKTSDAVFSVSEKVDHSQDVIIRLIKISNMSEEERFQSMMDLLTFAEKKNNNKEMTLLN